MKNSLMHLKEMLLLCVLFCVVSPAIHAQTYAVERLNNGQPIIDQSMFDALGATYDEGRNMNGPGVVRVPFWVDPGDRAHPSAEYYMYFAHHGGNYIRLAWAVDIEGPWTLHDVGSGVPNDERGVLDLGPDDTLFLGNDLTASKHIASPFVVVNHAERRFEMYFHASKIHHEGVQVSGQKTLVATSASGLEFAEADIVPVILGRSYFHVFEARDNLYALANNGDLFKAQDALNPWTPPAGFDFSQDLWEVLPAELNPFVTDIAEAGLEPLRLRHSSVRVVCSTLHVFYTRKEDFTERILLSTIDMSAGDFDVWDATFPPEEIMQVELDWEGGDLPPAQSDSGPAPEDVHQLRDPFVFEDEDGTLYLFYAGRGEDAIGLARLDRLLAEPACPGSGDSTDVDGNGVVNASDVQLVINAALDIDTGYQCDIDGDGAVNAVDVQLVINAVLGL